MKKTVLMYGLISGALSAVMLLLTIPYMEDLAASNKGALVGYTAMLLAAILVFFGVRSYREHRADGRLSFGRAFAVGILITTVSAVCYTLTWEIAYFGAVPSARDKIVACFLQHGPGANDTKPTATVEERIADFRRWYDNPLLNSAATFTEPFPVGLVVTTLSAAILRRRAQ
jgi:hypothetical protein